MEPALAIAEAKKRKREEIADSQSEDGEVGSEDEDYGWGEDDEAVTDKLAHEPAQRHTPVDAG